MPDMKDYDDLLKQVVRAAVVDKELLRYHHLWEKYKPSKWWFEILNVVGRMGYGFLVLFPRELDRGRMISSCKAGALLSAVLVALTAYLKPYRRNTENLMLLFCNAAVLIFFGIQDGAEFYFEEHGTTWSWQRVSKYHTRISYGIIACCLTGPLLLVAFLASAYVLPSRHIVWAEKICLDEFIKQFGRSLKQQVEDRRVSSSSDSYYDPNQSSTATFGDISSADPIGAASTEAPSEVHPLRTADDVIQQ